MISWLTYLLEVSVCHALFFLVYYGFLRNLSFFQMNRVFLLSVTLLGFIIPLLDIPVWNNLANDTVAPFTLNPQKLNLTDPVMTESKEISNTNWLILLLSTIYFSGVSLRLWKLMRGMSKVLALIKDNEISEYEGIRTIYLKDDSPSFFAFLNYLFINASKLKVSSGEFRQIVDHEKVHISNMHTLDHLLLELAIAICWINPVLYLLKRELSQVHEFSADQKARGINGDTENYARLILRLSSNNENQQYLTHQFSMKNIKKRIIMLNTPQNQTAFMLRYLAIFPAITLLLVLFSFSPKSQDNEVINETSQKIGNISWSGNTIHSDEFLTEYLGLKQGDPFSEEAINAKLNYHPDGSDLGSLYMDKGYLFLSINMKKTIRDEAVDLVFEINEGDVFTISKVTVSGNFKIENDNIADHHRLSQMIEIKTGDIFNRSKLIESQRKIAESGLFDPTNVNPNLVPNPAEKTVEIEFEVSEL